MTYYGASEIARSFRTVRKNTIQIAEEIPEDRYGFVPAPGSRSVAQTLVHIAVSPQLQQHLHGELKLDTLEGFDFFGYFGGLMAEEQKPRGKAEILSLLRERGESYANWAEGLSDGFLGQQVRYPEGMQPPVKSRFEMIISPKEHEMHHRGQLMLVERLLSMTPHLTRQMMATIAARQR